MKKMLQMLCALVVVLIAMPASAQSDPYADGFYHVTYGSRTDPRPCSQVEQLKAVGNDWLYVCTETTSDLKRVIHGYTDSVSEPWVEVIALSTVPGKPYQPRYIAQDARGKWWDVEDSAKTPHIDRDPVYISPFGNGGLGSFDFSRRNYSSPEENSLPERDVCGHKTRDYQLIGDEPARINHWFTGAYVCVGQKHFDAYYTVRELWIWNGVTRYLAQDRATHNPLRGGLWHLARDNERGNGYTELRDVHYAANAVFARGISWESGHPTAYMIFENRRSGPFAEQRKGPFTHSSKLQVVDGHWLFAAAKAKK